MTCTANFDGTTSASRTFIRSSTNITTASGAMTTAGAQSAFIWVPGQYFAAKDQADYLASQSSLGTTGTSGSTTASRAATYGTAGSGYTEIILGSTDSA